MRLKHNQQDVAGSLDRYIGFHQYWLFNLDPEQLRQRVAQWVRFEQLLEDVINSYGPEPVLAAIKLLTSGEYNSETSK